MLIVARFIIPFFMSESDFDSMGSIGQPCRTMIMIVYQLGRA